MKFLSTPGYYDTEFEYRFRYKPHEGEIPAALKQDFQEGKKWPLEKLDALVSWMFKSQRREGLFYDAVIVCDYIAKKIGRCPNVKDKDREYEINRRRLERIRDSTFSFYKAVNEIDLLTSKTALGARIRASWMLHDYDDIAEIQEGRDINQKHYAFVQNEIRRLRNISKHPPVMRLRHKKRQEYKGMLGNINTAASEPLLSLNEINSCFIAEQKDRNERSLREIILDSAY